MLGRLSEKVERLYVSGRSPQLNLLTDRLLLDQMNNCGAGETTITLAPDGRFYVCPAFYQSAEGYAVGDLEHGIDIKNQQLYRLDHALTATQKTILRAFGIDANYVKRKTRELSDRLNPKNKTVKI